MRAELVQTILPDSEKIAEIDAPVSSASPLQRAQHALDFRVSLPAPGGGIYLVLLAGSEKRNATRLACEGQTHATRVSIAFLFLTLVSLAFLGLGCITFLYIVKSMAGIDLFDGPSFLHNLAYFG